MTTHQSPARAAQPAGSLRALRFLALTAVIVGVLGLAAAAFELSYPGIHAIALVAGVSPALARLYPLIFDAMLVVASAAILSLRGAGAATRCYAWFSLLLLLCAAAGADALHATGSKLPHRGAAATAAIIPWALVLLGFGLLLAMLRHARLRRAQAVEARASAAPPAAVPATRPAAAVVPAAVVPAAVVPAAVVPAAVVPAAVVPAAVVPAAVVPAAVVPAAVVPAAVVPAAVTPPAVTPPAAAPAAAAPAVAPAASPWPGSSWPGTDEDADAAGRSGELADSQAPELALDAEPGHDDPTSDEAHQASDSPARWVPRARAAEQQDAGRREFAADPAPIMAPAPTVDVFPGRPAGPELDHGAVPEPDNDAGAGPDRDGGAGPDRDGGAGLAQGAALQHDDTAGRGPEAEPAPAHRTGPEGEPEPAAAAAAAPFERMWSSPTPPDV
jgi:Protein of unknown function (DUF2637)